MVCLIYWILAQFAPAEILKIVRVVCIVVIVLGPDLFVVAPGWIPHALKCLLLYTDITFTNAPQGGITAAKLNLLIDDLSTAIGAGGGGGTGTGDMLKSVYDTNNNGQVDTCDSVSWASVSGKPSTFPPDSTAMLKSVYDTNADNVVDHSAVSDSVPWTGVTGKPATFPPDGTAMLKATYDPGNDGIVDHAALADTAPWTGISGKPALPPDSTAELVARKGVASGYAGLDGTTKVPMAQLPAPTSGDATTAQLVKGDDTRLTNSRTQVLPWRIRPPAG